MKNTLNLTVSFAVISMIISNPAFAQNTSATATNDDKTEVIVVTALKRSQTLQSVPATITALSSASLEQSGVNSLESIEGQVPGLSFGNSGFNGAAIGLRGISSQRSNTGDEAAVAVHIDGIFQPQSSQALARLFDVQRVEVLAGPQGTLYGRNANAGVINVITKGPTAVREGTAQISYGEFNTVRAEGMYNIPLNDTSGIRISGTYAKGDGFIENKSTSNVAPSTIGGDDYFGARIRYNGTFGEKLRVEAGLQYTADQSTRDQAQTYSNVGLYEGYWDAPTSTDRADVNYFVQIDYDFSKIGFRSLTGGATFDNEFRNDVNYGLPIGSRYENFGANDGWSISQELSLYSLGENRFDWRVGAFFQYSDLAEQRKSSGFLDTYPVNPNGPITKYYLYQDFDLTQIGNASAVFADATFNATDRFSINTGLRYTYETKEGRQIDIHSEDGFGPGSGAPPPTTGAKDCSVAYNATNFRTFVFPACRSEDKEKFEWDGLTGRLGVNYQATEDVLAYASYSRGFRSGSIGGLIGTDNFFDAIFGGPANFGLVKLDQETVDNYEAGIKSQFYDRKVTLNVTAFYAQFNDMLFTVADPVTFRFVEGNLGLAESRGIDLQFSFRPTTELTLSFNGQLLDTKVMEAPPASFFAGVPQVKVGNELPRSPNYSFAPSISYDIPLTNQGNINLFAEYNYKGKHYFDLANNFEQSAYGLLNLSARYEAPGDRWYGFINGRNVTDEEYLLAGGRSKAANSPSAGAQRPGMPLTYEVGIGFKF
jgi:iron complex outermembrane recepter protein